ncbi:MAG TPA: hypothetical protein VJZ93_04300 [Candidatus Nanoarchaeia archaeon]|nr:hypothetical protein [Candidatus Nanoarchaeia archaeon]
MAKEILIKYKGMIEIGVESSEEMYCQLRFIQYMDEIPSVSERHWDDRISREVREIEVNQKDNRIFYSVKDREIPLSGENWRSILREGTYTFQEIRELMKEIVPDDISTHVHDEYYPQVYG